MSSCIAVYGLRRCRLQPFALQKTTFCNAIDRLLLARRPPFDAVLTVFGGAKHGLSQRFLRHSIAQIMCNVCKLLVSCFLTLHAFACDICAESFVLQKNAALKRQCKSMCHGFSPCHCKTSGVSFALYDFTKSRMLKNACTPVDF